MEKNNFEKYDHPRDWSIEDLMIYLQYEMNYPIKKISTMSEQQMIDEVLKNEIEQE